MTLQEVPLLFLCTEHQCKCNSYHRITHIINFWYYFSVIALNSTRLKRVIQMRKAERFMVLINDDNILTLNRTTFKKVIQMRSTESFSGFPYAIALYNCILYTWYGSPLISNGWENIVVMVVNAVGFVLECCFICIYLTFAPPKPKVLSCHIYLLQIVLRFHKAYFCQSTWHRSLESFDSSKSVNVQWIFLAEENGRNGYRRVDGVRNYCNNFLFGCPWSQQKEGRCRNCRISGNCHSLRFSTICNCKLYTALALYNGASIV